MRALLFVFLCIYTNNTLSNTTPHPSTEALSNALSLQYFVAGNFNQLRTIKGFKQTLKSSGRFQFWRNQGLYWEINKPFFQATTYSKNKTLHWSAQGQLIANSPSNAVQRHINKTILSLFSADEKELNKIFQASDVKRNGHTWTLVLSPKMKAMKKTIANISLSGDQYIREVTITSAARDVTQIMFTDIRESEMPSPQEKKLFSAY